MKTVFFTIFIFTVFVASAAIIKPNFHGWDWLGRSSSDVVVVHCDKLGKMQPLYEFGPGHFNAAVKVISTLKGATNVNSVLLWTDHPLIERGNYLTLGHYISPVPRSKFKPRDGPLTDEQKKKIITTNSIWNGESYLVIGSHETGRETGVYEALEEYRIIPLGSDFSTNSIAGKPLDEQLQILFRRALEVTKDPAEKVRLEAGIVKK